MLQYTIYKELFEKQPARFAFICDHLKNQLDQIKSTYFTKLNWQAWELY